jgi:hypothetical protein
VPRAMPVLPDNTVLQYNQAVRRVPRSENGLYLTQPQSQMLEHWEHDILEESQGIQFGLEIGVSDGGNDVLVPATQY